MTAPRTRLSSLLQEQQETILHQWREAVRELTNAYQLPQPVLNDQIHEVLREMIEKLDSSQDEQPLLKKEDHIPEGPAAGHGVERLRAGFDIDEVVAEYNVLRHLVFETAHKAEIELRRPLVHMVNAVVDRSIAVAVKNYARQNAIDERRSRAEYIAFVSHEMRSPLSAISAAVDRLAHPELKTDPASMEKLLRRNVERLNKLIGHLIEESKQISQDLEKKRELQWIALQPLAKALIIDFEDFAQESGTELVCTVPPGLKTYADPNFLDVIIGNLVKNAIEHAEAGCVQIGAALDDHGEGICVWVEDDGRGIAEDQLRKIFDPYQTNRGEEGGSGLGLYIARRFTEAHGATIEAQNIDSGGARFQFTLPNQGNSSTG